MKNVNVKELANEMFDIRKKMDENMDALNEKECVKAMDNIEEFINLNATKFQQQLIDKLFNSFVKGNHCLDFNNLNNTDIAGLVLEMKEQGIHEFTFSSTWSSAVEQAWELEQAGCSCQGLVKIVGGCKYREDGDEVPAFLFKL